LLKIEIPHQADIGSDELLEEPTATEVGGRRAAARLDQIGAGSASRKIQLEEEIVRAFVATLRIATERMSRSDRLPCDGPYGD
jgi:hypothetical protein